MTTQLHGGMDGMDAGRDGIAPPVRLEACAEFRVDHTSSWPVCNACGWLDADHESFATAIAVVSDLSRRRAVQLPERKAS